MEKKENLENAKKVVAEFERRLSAEVKRPEKLDMVEKKDFRKEMLEVQYEVYI